MSDTEMEIAPSQSRLTGNRMMEVATTRAAQEVQAAVVMAKRFPRSTVDARNRILDACKRPRLAEAAIYTYPRGGTNIEGPSIRLAECLSQCWGNMDSGVIELEQRDGESVMMAYAMDWETNTRDSKVFTVKHVREKRGGNVRLTDPRDIYEMTANQAARRKRACILAIIPADIIEDAIEQCNQTLAGKSGKPLADRTRDMVQAFAGMAVTSEMIERRLGTRLEAITEAHIVQLKKVFISIRDNMGSVADYFPPAESDAKPKGVAGLAEKLKTKPTPESGNPPQNSASAPSADPKPEETSQGTSAAAAGGTGVSSNGGNGPVQSGPSEAEILRNTLKDCREAGDTNAISDALHALLAKSGATQNQIDAELLRISGKGKTIVKLDDAKIMAAYLRLGEMKAVK